MKKLYAILSMLLMTALALHAAKSKGVPFDVLQPDGTTLTARLLGDEHFSWYQTLDGVLLKYEGDAFYVGKVADDGSLVSSGMLAHNVSIRSSEEAAQATAQDKTRFFASQKQINNEGGQRKVIEGYPKDKYCPHMGTVRIPIIMVNYADKDFVYNDRSVWEEYFNGMYRNDYSAEDEYAGYGSVSMYFRDASNGLFAPEFDIYGPYTLSKNHDYYGSQRYNLVREAVKLADGDIDFSEYDSNNDGRVDMVYVLYAGTGANVSNKSTDVWPCCYYDASISTEEDMAINIIGCANELLVEGNPVYGSLRAGIGVTCHEMSHGMGLPDLYRTLSEDPIDSYGYFDLNNCGPEDWDLMDGGENVGNGAWPCQYTAWERDIMGWTQLETLNEPATITLYPLNKGGKAYKVVNPSNENEYYVIENYQYDEWNQYMFKEYGSGLMIFHVNSSDTGFSMSPNNTYGKPDISILPADGFVLALYSQGYTIMYRDEVVSLPDGYSKYLQEYFIPETMGDPYPGSQNVTSLKAYKNYAGDHDLVDDFPITNIRMNADMSITFDFMGGDMSDGIGNVPSAHSSSAIYTTYGIYVGTDRNSLPRGVYIQDGVKFFKF